MREFWPHRVAAAARSAGEALLVVLAFLVTVVALAEPALRKLYAYAAWSTERSPLVYERVYWAVPPWVRRTSILYDDP